MNHKRTQEDNDKRSMELLQVGFVAICFALIILCYGVIYLAPLFSK